MNDNQRDPQIRAMRANVAEMDRCVQRMTAEHTRLLSAIHWLLFAVFFAGFGVGMLVQHIGEGLR